MGNHCPANCSIMSQLPFSRKITRRLEFHGFMCGAVSGSLGSMFKNRAASAAKFWIELMIIKVYLFVFSDWEILWHNLFLLYSGKEVYDKDGELVCVKPFPSMPIYFGNDPDGAKYRKAYFDKYDGVCCLNRFVCIFNCFRSSISKFWLDFLRLMNTSWMIYNDVYHYKSWPLERTSMRNSCCAIYYEQWTMNISN